VVYVERIGTFFVHFGISILCQEGKPTRDVVAAPLTIELVTSTRYLLGMNHGLLLRLWHALADWWSFQMGTIESWFDRTPETPEDRAIREKGERIRKAFPSIDFGRPGARKTPPEPR
jgi:hypothetical protein